HRRWDAVRGVVGGEHERILETARQERGCGVCLVMIAQLDSRRVAVDEAKIVFQAGHHVRVRAARVDHEIDVSHREAGLAQTVADRVRRKSPGGVLDAGEALLLGRRLHLTVDDERSGRIPVALPDSPADGEDVHSGSLESIVTTIWTNELMGMWC